MFKIKEWPILQMRMRKLKYFRHIERHKRLGKNHYRRRHPNKEEEMIGMSMVATEAGHLDYEIEILMLRCKTGSEKRKRYIYTKLNIGNSAIFTGIQGCGEHT
uniref:Uncharacterized protein n=1 Tax=Arion vulgaris TaxID=1028688 RepID=A0A0B7ADI8_9EUPU